MTSTDAHFQELKVKIYRLWNSICKDNDDIDLSKIDTQALREAAVVQSILRLNINELKDFLVDKNGKGEKPRLIVSAPVINPRNKIMEDRFFMPRPSEYNQEKLDWLKKHQLVSDYAIIQDYDFLFEYQGASKK
jgi:hypothetical protein